MRSRVAFVLTVLAFVGCVSQSAKGPTVSPMPPAANACPQVSSCPPISKVDNIEDLAAVKETLSKLSQPTTLLVLDIDDTLLTAEGFFGSDYWFGWQFKGAAGGQKVHCLFDVSAMSYEMGAMKRTQDDGPELIAALMVDKLIETSRNPGVRAATERELLAAGYSLPEQLTADKGPLGFVAPGDASNSRLTYEHGIFMTKGGNKGTLLLELLKRLQRSYLSVVLVDDSGSNIKAMQEATGAAGMSYYGLHYVKIKKPIPLSDSLVAEGDASWARLLEFMRATYPGRYARLIADDCAYH